MDQLASGFAIRKRDLSFYELFRDYEPWLPADQILNPQRGCALVRGEGGLKGSEGESTCRVVILRDQKRVVRFSNVPVDAESSADLELKLRTSLLTSR